MDRPVTAALQELLPKLEPVLKASLGPDCVLIECSALIVDPDSPSQVLHADTMWTPHPEVMAVFVALQDITADMGPTQMLPKTHSDAAYWRKAVEESNPEKILSDPEYLRSVLGTPPLHECQLDSGTAVVMDTRLLHCGSTNRSSKRRTLFYLTFAKPDCAKDIPEVPEGLDLDENVSLRRVANSFSYQKIARALKEEYGDLLTLQGLTEKLASGTFLQ
jgi:ectoine hydroxylase-related dioxygenase (phytanoyl-CoA dioxygenase family)